MRRWSPDFTLCLPVSPKVNAGGARGAWLPWRALFRFPVSTSPARPRAPRGPKPAKTLVGTTLGQARAMDGAGRSARSLRSPEPQADLKAAAIGAAVLL